LAEVFGGAVLADDFDFGAGFSCPEDEELESDESSSFFLAGLATILAVDLGLLEASATLGLPLLVTFFSFADPDSLVDESSLDDSFFTIFFLEDIFFFFLIFFLLKFFSFSYICLHS